MVLVVVERDGDGTLTEGSAEVLAAARDLAESLDVPVEAVAVALVRDSVTTVARERAPCRARNCSTAGCGFCSSADELTSAYELLKHRSLLSVDDFGLFAVGFVFAFASAFLCVRWLLRYISQHDFTVFAWYRIGFGALVLITAYAKLVDWTVD